MTAPWLGATAFAAVVAVSAPARASLTASEAEQIRHDVATTSELGRVRALVARPDLTASEAAAAMSNALATTSLDPSHVSFLHELVFGAASTASRPVLAAATVAGTLARADALLAKQPLGRD